MKLRGVLEKIFVFDESSPGASQLNEPEKGANPGALPSRAAAARFDLTEVYRERDISSEPFTAEQALALLEHLPTALRGPTKKQVLIDLLTDNRTTPEAVAEDAQRKIGALTAEADDLTEESAEFVTATEQEIGRLEAAIREKREAIEQAKLTGEQSSEQCRTEAERLKTLLQFLG